MNYLSLSLFGNCASIAGFLLTLRSFTYRRNRMSYKTITLGVRVAEALRTASTAGEWQSAASLCKILMNCLTQDVHNKTLQKEERLLLGKANYDLRTFVLQKIDRRISEMKATSTKSEVPESEATPLALSHRISTKINTVINDLQRIEGRLISAI